MNISTNQLVQAVQSVISGFEQTSSGSKVTVQELADMANSSYTTIREIKKCIPTRSKLIIPKILVT